MHQNPNNMAIYHQIENLLAKYLQIHGFPTTPSNLTDTADLFDLATDGLYYTMEPLEPKLYCLLLHVPGNKLLIDFCNSDTLKQMHDERQRGLGEQWGFMPNETPFYCHTPPAYVFAVSMETWLMGGTPKDYHSLETSINNEPASVFEAFLARARKLLPVPADAVIEEVKVPVVEKAAVKPDSPLGHCVMVRNLTLPRDHPDRRRVWTGRLVAGRTWPDEDSVIWTSIKSPTVFSIRKRSDAERVVEIMRRSADLMEIDLTVHQIEVVDFDPSWRDRFTYSEE